MEWGCGSGFVGIGEWGSGHVEVADWWSGDVEERGWEMWECGVGAVSVAMAEWTNEHASEGVWERGSGGVWKCGNAAMRGGVTG